MGNRRRLLIAVSIAGLACAACASEHDTSRVGAASTATIAPSGTLRPAMPHVGVTTISGEPANLVDAARGRVALVALWATWCEPCLREADALKRLDAQAAAEGDAVVLGVAVGEERGQVATFAAEHRLAYARFVDEGFRLADALGEHRVPTTLVLDRGGRIVYRGGALDARALEAFRRARREAANPEGVGAAEMRPTREGS